MKRLKYIALICLVSVLTGCKTPVEKQVAHIDTSNGFQPEIQFVLEKVLSQMKFDVSWLGKLWICRMPHNSRASISLN